MPPQKLNLFKAKCIATNAIGEERNAYFSQLNEAEPKSVVQMLKTFVDNRTSDKDELIDIEQYNKEIDKSLAEIESGELYTHEEVTKLMKNL